MEHLEIAELSVNQTTSGPNDKGKVSTPFTSGRDDLLTNPSVSGLNGYYFDSDSECSPYPLRSSRDFRESHQLGIIFFTVNKQSYILVTKMFLFKPRYWLLFQGIM